MTDQALSDGLLGQIKQKRAQMERFLQRAIPRKRRLLNLAIVGGTLAAALTTGPALGGQSFTAALTKALGLTSPAWQLLCGTAALCSMTASVATQLLKSQSVEEQVLRAQGCRAKLEMLEVGLTLGHLELTQARADYLRCVEDAAFLSPEG
jgi:hypothetical protein